MSTMNEAFDEEVKSESVESQPEPKPEPEPAEPKSSKWSDYGLDPRYDTLPQEQIAREIAFHNKVIGRQGQELGEYRKKVAEYEAKLQRFMEAADRPASKPDAGNGWDEIKNAQFMKMIDDGKVPEALQLAIGERLKPNWKDEELTKAVDQRVQEHLRQFYGWQREQSIASDPDYPKFAEYIATLKGEEYLGSQRDPKELLDLSKLVVENKSLADITYMNMKNYPNMSFSDAKKFASLTLGSSVAGEQKKNDFKQTVGQLNGVTKPKGNSSNASTEPQFKTMEEAFAS